MNFSNAAGGLPADTQGVRPDDISSLDGRRVLFYLQSTLSCATTVMFVAFERGLILGKNAPRKFLDPARICYHKHKANFLIGVKGVPIR